MPTIIGIETSLRHGLSVVGRLSGRSVIISYDGGRFHFRAPIRALVVHLFASAKIKIIPVPPYSSDV